VAKFIQNKSPSADALGDWFPLRTYFLSSKASPNDSRIVIVVIIVVTGKAELILHGDGIIAQTYCSDADLVRPTNHPGTPAKIVPMIKSSSKTGRLNSKR
jgi:hypothetical protein